MTHSLITTLTAAALLAVAAVPAQAQASDSGPWLVRVRALHLNSANKDGTDLGANLSINNKTFPELDISYFFTPNLAAELVLTYPQKQTVYANGAAIGSFKHLPPTLMAQYHFPTASVRPYVGLGVNQTLLSSVSFNNPAIGLKHSSTGLAAQVGVDLPLGGGWLLNADLKKVQIGANVYVAGVDHGKFKIDPTLFSLGIGKRF